MNIVSIIVVFIILWWLVLFMVLPFGIEPEQNPEDGNMRGAPKFVMLKKKLIITSIITVLLTFGYYYAVEHNYFDFLEINPRAKINDLSVN